MIKSDSSISYWEHLNPSSVLYSFFIYAMEMSNIKTQSLQRDIFREINNIYLEWHFYTVIVLQFPSKKEN